MDRLLASTQASVAINLIDSAGNSVTAGSAVTAAVTDSTRVAWAFGSGTAITGSPFTATESPTGTYTITIPATSLTVFDTFDVVWTWSGGNRRETQFETVGSFIFSVPELRAYEPALTDASKYPVGHITKIRSAIEDLFESAADYSFIRRGARLWLNGNNDYRIRTAKRPGEQVVSASIRFGINLNTTPTALTSTQLTALAVDVDGTVIRTDFNYWPWGWSNVQMFLRYGCDVVPEEIKNDALVFARSILLTSPLQTGRETTVNTSIGTVALAVAGTGRPTGFPQIDADLASYAVVP